ncbi:mitochondrial chaperone BCS1-like [Paramacrobiotus metropolitanus]|uniref:mitochondrial chaperone BCS1-like n=1 Tax=Paramacrobiotus metropolitanus TaxID=2943436 RepID=UPI002445CF95|nr:mitochondrial chaperone BCS1-like [Paramacrobiotus metropolitanus]
MVLTAASLSQFLPDGLNLTGGLGLFGILGVLFPYIEKLIGHLFNFNVTEYFGKFFGSNSVLGTSFGIVGIGALVALLQQIWNYGWNLYNEYFSISLEIPSSDSSYWEMLEWIHTRQMKNPKHLSLQTETQQSTNGKWETVYEFVPNVGTHNFKFQGKKFVIERRREEKAEAYSMNRLENVILSATGSDTTVFRDMLAAVKKYKEIKNQGKTLMYTASQGCWQSSGTGKRKRPLDSVILDDGVSERILNDIQDFMDSSEWYSQFGVPYRRGYLLYGPPGTGKTSFISALAGHFDLNVCVLNLSDKSLTDDGLNRLLIDAPEDSIVLLEDVDAAFGNREDATEPKGTSSSDSEQKETTASHSSTAFEGMNRLTFSGLLNALDGVASAEGRILFMTTNYVDRLDAALVRPGRIDARQYVGYASESQVDRMFRRFYRKCTDDDAARFVKAVFDRPERPNISLAQLQGLFLQYKSNPADVFCGIPMLYE